MLVTVRNLNFHPSIQSRSRDLSESASGCVSRIAEFSRLDKIAISRLRYRHDARFVSSTNEDKKRSVTILKGWDLAAKPSEPRKKESPRYVTRGTMNHVNPSFLLSRSVPRWRGTARPFEFVSLDRWNRITRKTIRLFKRALDNGSPKRGERKKKIEEGTRPMTERWLPGIKKKKEKRKKVGEGEETKIGKKKRGGSLGWDARRPEIPLTPQKLRNLGASFDRK